MKAKQRKGKGEEGCLTCWVIGEEAREGHLSRDLNEMRDWIGETSGDGALGQREHLVQRH